MVATAAIQATERRNDRRDLPHARLRRPLRQARARARRSQRADGERQDHRRHAHRARRADHQGDRRQGRQGDPAGAFRPAEGARSEGVAQAGRRRGRPRASRRMVAFADDCVGEAAENAVAAMQRRRYPAVWKTRASTRKRKRTIRLSSSSSPSSGDIYVNDAFSAAHRAHASTEGLARKLPAYAGRAMQAELEALGKALDSAEASGDRDRRRRQGFDQA